MKHVCVICSCVVMMLYTGMSVWFWNLAHNGEHAQLIENCENGPEACGDSEQSSASFSQAEAEIEPMTQYNVTRIKSQNFEGETGSCTIETEDDCLHACEWCDIVLTQEEYELLCEVVYCEAGNQPIETQTMVALTVLNRINNSIGGDNITDVVYFRNAYEVTTWYNFGTIQWNDLTEQAVIDALRKNNHPGGMMFFRTEHYHSFGFAYMQSGDLYFSLDKQEE